MTTSRPVWLCATLPCLLLAASSAAAQSDDPQQPDEQRPPIMQLEPPADQQGQPPPGYGEQQQQPQQQQQGYGQQQQGYGQQQPAYPQPEADPAAGWRSGDPVPPGYRVASSPNWVLVGIGAGVFGGSYISVALIGYSIATDGGDENAYKLLIPIAGPLLMIQDTSGPLEGLADAMLLFDAALQIAGATMLTLGLVLQRERIVPDQRAGVTPYLGPTGAGLVGRF